MGKVYIVFAQISAWIAGPVIVALFLGKYLDIRFGTDPWIFLGLTGVAFIISCVGIVRVAFSYIKENEKEKKDGIK